MFYVTLCVPCYWLHLPRNKHAYITVWNRCSRWTHEAFLVEVDERERKWNIEWLVLARVSGTFARLKSNHQIDPTGRATSLEQRNEVGTEDVRQKLLEFAVNTYTQCPHYIQRGPYPQKSNTDSGAGTNLKVGGTGPEQKWGHRSGAEIFLSYPSTFLALKAQLVVLVSAFVMVSTVWSVYCLLSSTQGAPRAQPFVKVGARAPRSQWSRRHWIYTDNQ